MLGVGENILVVTLDFTSVATSQMISQAISDQENPLPSESRLVRLLVFVFLDMTRSQMLQKVECNLPAKL